MHHTKRTTLDLPRFPGFVTQLGEEEDWVEWKLQMDQTAFRKPIDLKSGSARRILGRGHPGLYSPAGNPNRQLPEELLELRFENRKMETTRIEHVATENRTIHNIVKRQAAQEVVFRRKR
jgi:hypothetical protein